MIGTLKFVPYKRKSLIRIPYKRIIFVLFQIENDWDHLKLFLIFASLISEVDSNALNNISGTNYLQSFYENLYSIYRQ